MKYKINFCRSTEIEVIDEEEMLEALITKFQSNPYDYIQVEEVK